MRLYPFLLIASFALWDSAADVVVEFDEFVHDSSDPDVARKADHRSIRAGGGPLHGPQAPTKDIARDQQFGNGFITRARVRHSGTDEDSVTKQQSRPQKLRYPRATTTTTIASWRPFHAVLMPVRRAISTTIPMAFQRVVGEPFRFSESGMSPTDDSHVHNHSVRDPGTRHDSNRPVSKDSHEYREPRHALGLPKIFWAGVCVVIAMACFVACIPFILNVAKRRRPILSS